MTNRIVLASLAIVALAGCESRTASDIASTRSDPRVNTVTPPAGPIPTNASHVDASPEAPTTTTSGSTPWQVTSEGDFARCFGGEIRDQGWASLQEPKLRKAALSLKGGPVIEFLECRSGLCKIVVSQPRDRVALAMSSVGWNLTTAMGRMGDTTPRKSTYAQFIDMSSGRVTVYMTKNGYEEPRFDCTPVPWGTKPPPPTTQQEQKTQ
jgi:hypothetical protein